MVADGWSGYNKYKQVRNAREKDQLTADCGQILKRAGSILNNGPPSKPKMKLFLQHKAYDEVPKYCHCCCVYAYCCHI